jgi:hypothetical protein
MRMFKVPPQIHYIEPREGFGGLRVDKVLDQNTSLIYYQINYTTTVFIELFE